MERVVYKTVQEKHKPVRRTNMIFDQEFSYVAGEYPTDLTVFGMSLLILREGRGPPWCCSILC